MAWLIAKLRPEMLPRAAVSLATLILVFARLMPGTVFWFGDDPDSGWSWGISTAVSHGLVFGRDIVFNYGPYGPAAIGIYDPALRGLILCGASILALSAASGWLALCRPLAAALAVLALPLVPMTDALAFSLPVPAILLCATARRGVKLPVPTVVAVFALIPGLALLALMKGSFIAASLLGVATICLLLFRARHSVLAVTLPCLMAACTIGLWAAAGQPLQALPLFFISTARIVAGHNEAMALPGPADHVLAAGLAALTFLGVFAWGARRFSWPARLVTAGGLAGLLFLAFKAGFVRQDGHEAITYASFGLIFALAATWLNRGAAITAAAIAIACLIGPLAPMRGIAAVPSIITARLTGEIAGTYHLLADPAAAARDFARNEATVPRLPWQPAGTSDIYSSGQSRLFSTGLAWSPRPVFQSYNVSTPVLAALNADHLRGPRAPDNIFFRVEPIDARVPALEDGLSWPLLLSLYEPAAYDDDTKMAWLRRAPAVTEPPVPGRPLVSGEQTLGAIVALPATQDALWARIDVRRSRVGLLAALLWQAPPLALHLRFADGTARSFHFIAGMGKAGFLLSPLAVSTLDFLRLRSHGDGGVDQPLRPVSMSLSAEPAGSWSWRPSYWLSLAPIAFPPAHGQVTVQGADMPILTDRPASFLNHACALDRVDGNAVPSLPARAPWPMALEGWALFDPAAGQQADRIDVAFQAQDGRMYAVPAQIGPRGDVATSFHMPGASHAGFSAHADLSHLAPGRYDVLAVLHRASPSRGCRLGFSVLVPAPP
jgi:hypothetical protein